VTRGVRRTAWLAALLAGAACGGGDAATPAGPGGGSAASLLLTVSGLVALDPLTQGRYEAWALDAQGRATSLGVLAPGEGGGATLRVPFPSSAPAALAVTVQGVGDAPGVPSAQRVLRGEWRGSRSTLGVEDAITRGGQPLKQVPGQFTMFSPSDNYLNGYPSFEECGVWLFNIAPRQTPQNDQWVRLTPLTPGWTYEGWMVRDQGSPDAIWLSYGKFVPDQSGAVAERDDTGWGPFSGVEDFATAGEEEYPGDDWFSNPLDFPFPSVLALPLDLREKDAQGRGRWTHVITVEPMTDKGEAIGSERPFAVRPYADGFGDAAPGSPRTITFRPEGVPRGEALRQ
jgi:hypothetical protein